MKTLSTITLLFLSILYSCKKTPTKYTPNPKAVELKNQAMELIHFLEFPDSSIKAISLLDSATAIDSNYFPAYASKLTFYYKLKQFDKAIAASNKMIQIAPNAHNLYLTSGFLYELIGDTSTSTNYFKKSLALCSAALDTMSLTNTNIVMYVTNKAVAEILLGDSLMADKTLRSYLDKLPEDPVFGTKEYIQSFMKKSRSEIFKMLTNPEEYSR